MFLFRFSVFFISLIILGGCSGNQSIQSLFSPDPELNENQSQPQVTSSQNNSSNSDQNKSKNNQNNVYPFAVYSSAKLVSSEGNKKTWISSDPVNDIKSFYKQELSSNKWSISEENKNYLIATNSDNNEQVKLTFLVSAKDTKFTAEYPFVNQVSSENSVSENQTSNNQKNTISSLESNSYLKNLVAKDIIELNSEELNPDKIVTRREYARWLIRANNKLHSDSPSLQIRLASENAKPVFTDVNNKDKDFAEIQGLAEAGLIPSTLTNDVNEIKFNPDAPLLRQDLIAWKVPLDIRKALPTVSLETIRETWGFQDATNMNPKIWRSLYVDWQNGEQSNIRRAFGYTTLFQPKKPVTLEEAAAVLSYFGYQGEGVSVSGDR